MKLTLVALISLSATSASAQTLEVRVIDRQEHLSSYNYVVPGYSTSNSSGSANCNGTATTTVYGNTANTNSEANCSGTSTTNTVSMPARAGSFNVRGATISLLLPDGRIAVVNCDIKFAEHFAGAAGNHRNCREPLVDAIQAEFHGDNAKLVWVVSLDGKKTQSETYKVLAILDKRNDVANRSSNASAAPSDVFWWFDEAAPPPNAALFEVIVTSRAYDGALAIVRQARQGNTSVQGGTSILDSNYHPSTVSLDSWQKSNPKSDSSLFYWQGEDVNAGTSVMHFEMTKRAYEQMLALVAGSDLRVRPSQTAGQNH
jgi:hypothetical protein